MTERTQVTQDRYEREIRDRLAASQILGNENGRFVLRTMVDKPQRDYFADDNEVRIIKARQEQQGAPVEVLYTDAEDIAGQAAQIIVGLEGQVYKPGEETDSGYFTDRPEDELDRELDDFFAIEEDKMEPARLLPRKQEERKVMHAPLPWQG